jgi:DNA invertase Pin-like site-specific DNA recombinase
MANYAYLRVSTNKQDVDNQRHGLLEYANHHHLVPLAFREDTVSGKVRWQERGIGKVLLQEAKKGDVVLAAEISRLARSTLQVLEIMEKAAEKGVSVHIVKNRMVMDSSIQSRITATVLGLAAEIEREFISARTVEALARRKAEGLPLGRPKGAKAKKVKLDEHRDLIIDYLKKGVSKASLARIIGCSPSTLYEWIYRNKLEKHVKGKGGQNG